MLAALAAITLALGCGGNAVLKSARTQLDAGAAESAYTSLQAEAARNPRDGDVLRLLAQAAIAVEEDSLAVDALARAEELGDKDREKVAGVRRRLWRDLAFSTLAVLDTLGRAEPADVDAARHTLERAVRLDPERAGTYAALATLAAHDGNEALADSLMGVSLERVPNDPESVPAVVSALMSRAERRALEERFDEAAEDARRAAALVPGDARVAYDLGVHLHRLGEATGDTALYEESLGQFLAVLSRLPKDDEARYNLALAAYRLGRLEVAQLAVDTLLARAPLHTRGHILAARLRLADRDTLAARGHVVAMRALRGEEVPLPGSSLEVTPVAGRAGAKHFVLEGPPDAIRQYDERNGERVEVWYFRRPPRVIGYVDGKVVAELELLTLDEGGRSPSTDGDGDEP